MSIEEWKKRGDEERPYRARRIFHEAKTSIEYGEKTWTTAQTVRDLMQNHLDAETERYFGDISSVVFEDEQLQSYLGEKGDAKTKKETENFLHSLYMFAKHVEDMTPETREKSEEYLQVLAKNLRVKSDVAQDGVFQSSRFLEQAQSLSEDTPLVSYEVTDTETNESLGWVAYETLRDEPMYQETVGGTPRYRIDGMK